MSVTEPGSPPNHWVLRPLPAQTPGVSWPADDWPRAALPAGVELGPPDAARRIKRLMTVARRPEVEAARAREEAVFVSLLADSRTNPGSALTAGLGS